MLLGAVTGLAAIACSSSSSGGGGSCQLSATSQPVFTTVTLGAGSSASCPTLAASDFNSSEDAGGSCPFQTSGCSATFNCTASGATVTGTVTASGSSFSGAFTVTVPAGTGGNVTCTYDVSGMID